MRNALRRADYWRRVILLRIARLCRGDGECSLGARAPRTRPLGERSPLTLLWIRVPLDKRRTHLKCTSFSYSIFVVLDKNKFKLIFIFDTFIVCFLFITFPFHIKKEGASSDFAGPDKAGVPNSTSIPWWSARRECIGQCGRVCRQAH